MKLGIFTGDNKLSIGGMQTNLMYLISYFTSVDMLAFVLFKSDNYTLYDCRTKTEESFDRIDQINSINDSIGACFFNDGHWIEEWGELRRLMPDSLFVYRTGGNEFVKAPYRNNMIDIQSRQKIWAEMIDKYIDFVISNSRYTTKRLLNQGIDDCKILTIRGGINLRECQQNYEIRSCLRKKFDSKYHTENKIVFSIVSRFEPFKGIMNILEVFRSLNSYDNFFLLLVGDGSERDALVHFCEQYFSESEYCILEKVDNRSSMRYIALSDYLINCSKLFNRKSGNDYYIHTETMGRSMYEAIYQYVPIIATDVGGTGELFDEFCNIGIKISDDMDEKCRVIERILTGDLICKVFGERYHSYSWDYITAQIYSPLFSSRIGKLRKKSVICLDIDETIYHPFLDYVENNKNLERVVSLSKRCDMILNSAANYDEILERYPVLAANKNEIIIVSNCGKHLYVYGQKDIFWENYMNSIPGIQSSIIDLVIKKLVESGLQIRSKKYIDRLYINIKIEGLIQKEIIDSINVMLKNTQYMVLNNKDNVKILSKIVNKAAPIKYLKVLNRDAKLWIGAGNNVLDYLFLNYCDISYVVNTNDSSFNSVSIRSNKDMISFLEKIEKTIGDF